MDSQGLFADSRKGSRPSSFQKGDRYGQGQRRGPQERRSILLPQEDFGGELKNTPP